MLLSYYCYILFIPMMMISSILMIISNSWFSMWMMMEINLISFISLIIFDKNIKNEVLINYFLVQVFNSYMYMLSMILFNYTNMNIIMVMMNMIMLIKLGMPPFYMWYIKIMNNLNWMNIFLMMTVQKIIPLMILNNILFYKFSLHINMLMMLLLGLFSSVKGLMQTNLKILFSYSSIIQMSWIIILMIFSEIMCLSYFLIYSLISLNLCMIFYKYNINNLNNMNMMKLNNKLIYYIINLSIFSMSAIPPFFGFLMKLLSMMTLYNFMPFIFLVLLIINSLISMFFYLRILFNNIMVNSISKKLNFKFINFKYKIKYKLLMLLWVTMVMLMIYEMM